MFGLSPYRKQKGIKRLDYLDDFFHMVDDWFDRILPFPQWEDDGFALNMEETEDAYILTASLNNCEKENIKIGFENGILMISAYNQMEQMIEKDDSIQKEQAYSKMQRGIYLKDAAGENIKAKYDNGILKIIVPKSKAVRPNQSIHIE